MKIKFGAKKKGPVSVKSSVTTSAPSELAKGLQVARPIKAGRIASMKNHMMKGGKCDG